MKKAKINYVIVLLATVVLTLFVLYSIDTNPLGTHKYLSAEKTIESFNKQGDDLQKILEPYGIDLELDITNSNNDNIGDYKNYFSYFAEIPLANNSTMTIDVWLYGLNDYPRCTITLEGDCFSVWEEALLNPAEYPALFEIMAYYSGGHLRADKLSDVATNMYRDTLDEVESGNVEDLYLSSQEMNGIFVWLADLSYETRSNKDGLKLYQTKLQYNGYARC